MKSPLNYANFVKGGVGSLAASAILAISLWELVAVLLKSPLFPRATEIGAALLQEVAKVDLYRHLAASFGVVSLGYAFSLALALPVALSVYRSATLGAILLPSHEFIRYIPVPAFVPLLAALIGIGDATKVSLIFIGTYFQVLFLFIVDLRSVPEEIEQSARTLGLRGLSLMREVQFPAALPSLLSTSRITFAWAWSYLLVAEVINAKRGIGFLVQQSYRVLNMGRLVALLVIIGLFGLSMDLLFKQLRRASCPWEYVNAKD